MMGPEQTRRLAADFLTHIGRSSTDEVLARIADDLEYWVPGKTALSGTHDKLRLGQMLDELATMFDGPLVITPHSMVAESNRAAVEASGGGLLANGNRYANCFHFLFEFDEDAKVVKLREYLDTGPIIEAIGTDIGGGHL